MFRLTRCLAMKQNRGSDSLLRLVNLVVRLREWAHKSLLENEERPDSFMERFRGPELKLAPSRSSNSQAEANGNGGLFKCVLLIHHHSSL